MGHKKFPVDPVFENKNDGKFFDTKGNPVRHGTEIIIVYNYNYHHLNNRPAVVEWDSEKGMYKYRITDGSQHSIPSDFYGIHEFVVTKF